MSDNEELWKKQISLDVYLRGSFIFFVIHLDCSLSGKVAPIDVVLLPPCGKTLKRQASFVNYYNYKYDDRYYHNYHSNHNQ